MELGSQNRNELFFLSAASFTVYARDMGRVHVIENWSFVLECCAHVGAGTIYVCAMQKETKSVQLLRIFTTFLCTVGAVNFEQQHGQSARRGEILVQQK